MSNSAVSLTVTNGEFYSCKSTPQRGGGIYIEGIGDVHIKQTLFLECIAEATNAGGSGGIEMWTVQKPPQIEECSFLLCKSGDDGGGLGIWSSPLYQETCVKECFFLECKLNHTTSSGGGGMIVWDSKAAIGCSECLFSKCHSAFIGGALCYCITSSTFTNIPLSSFCFFNQNTAKENCGNDAYFLEWTPTAPFLHSFSTSSSFRIAVAPSTRTWTDVTTYMPSDNWLPQGLDLNSSSFTANILIISGNSLTVLSIAFFEDTFQY